MAYAVWVIGQKRAPFCDVDLPIWFIRVGRPVTPNQGKPSFGTRKPPHFIRFRFRAGLAGTSGNPVSPNPGVPSVLPDANLAMSGHWASQACLCAQTIRMSWLRIWPSSNYG
jgi:hypothetical protein